MVELPFLLIGSGARHHLIVIIALLGETLNGEKVVGGFEGKRRLKRSMLLVLLLLPLRAAAAVELEPWGQLKKDKGVAFLTMLAGIAGVLPAHRLLTQVPDDLKRGVVTMVGHKHQISPDRDDLAV